VKVLLQTEPFDPGSLLAEFTAGRADVGGVVSFTGLARADGGPRTTLELEAYPGFTEKEIARIAIEATTRFSLLDVLVVHRTGEMQPGDAIVFVAAAARHRREAFEAADFMMDYLKSRAPFWKKESGADGSRWVEPSARDHADAARWDVTLRKATRDDHQAMEALQTRASLAAGEHAEALRANAHVIVTDLANVEAGRAVIAERDGRLIGFVTLEAARDRDMEIEGLFVEPDHWRKGLGARLMDEAETMARAAGARTLIVTVGQVAEPFYQSQGFVAAGEATTLFGPATRMQKLL
jgi:molybdopterin synthase catalytic subunit